MVAVFWEAGEDHPDLQRLVREFPRCRDNAEIITVDSVDLTRLVPTERASYRYRGSLTTAPYSEGVSWIVMASPLTARAATLAELETDFPGGTARSAHPLYRRTIETDVPRVR
ncbi:carbonic anhydrase family protein [Marinactinospora thermotolerans]|uniref:carbonic anhydrase family protein n=1 Tax=Marinactinospora thermotolerans TaxID=531310 RepID=UPI003D8D3F9C